MRRFPYNKINKLNCSSAALPYLFEQSKRYGLRMWASGKHTDLLIHEQ